MRELADLQRDVAALQQRSGTHAQAEGADEGVQEGCAGVLRAETRRGRCSGSLKRAQLSMRIAERPPAAHQLSRRRADQALAVLWARRRANARVDAAGACCQAPRCQSKARAAAAVAAAGGGAADAHQAAGSRARGALHDSWGDEGAKATGGDHEGGSRRSGNGRGVEGARVGGWVGGLGSGRGFERHGIEVPARRAFLAAAADNDGFGGNSPPRILACSSACSPVNRFARDRGIFWRVSRAGWRLQGGACEKALRGGPARDGRSRLRCPELKPLDARLAKWSSKRRFGGLPCMGPAPV